MVVLQNQSLQRWTVLVLGEIVMKKFGTHFWKKWKIFKDSMEVLESEKLRQLYQCCNEDLGEAILKGHANIVKFSKQKLLCMIKQLSVIVRHSVFLRSSESCYPVVEGESLAIVCALEQSRYFTQWCDRLLVLTDHRPLVKLFGGRTLDEIANPRFFRLKQRSFLWRFNIYLENYSLLQMQRHAIQYKPSMKRKIKLR